MNPLPVSLCVSPLEQFFPPNVTVQDDRPTEHLGSVNLSCSPLNSGVTLRWFVDNELVMESDRLQLSADRRTLTIPRVSRNDSGIYQCEARNELTFSLSSPVVINVTYGPDPPMVSSVGSDFVIGSNLTLSCFASSNPAAHYTWWVNGTEGPSGQQLFIPNISRRNSGVYACKATNPLSGLHSTVETAISISETLTQPGVVLNNSGPVENKDSVNLTCVPPRSTVAIFWFKDGEVLLRGRRGLDLSPDNRTLTLEVVTRNDSGLYQCEARNPAVASIGAPITLKVIYGPDIPIVTPPNSTFVEGSALTISCFSDSNPPAQYRWEIDGTPGPSTQHLSIPDVSLDNSGVYTCEASNIITHHRSTAQARIQVSGLVSGPASTSLSIIKQILQEIQVGQNLVSELMDIPHRGFSPWKRFLLTASLLTSWSSQGAAQLTIVSQPSIAVVGENVLLSLHGLQEGSFSTLTWYQGLDFLDAVLSYSADTGTVTTGLAFTLRESLQPNGSLIINGVSLTDSGNYSVLVHSRGSGLMSATGSFRVFEMPSKPTIFWEGRSDVVEFQTPGRFSCVSQDVGVNIQWFLNNTHLPLGPHLSLSSDNRTLTFDNVTRRDTGYYQCEVWNLVGAQSSDSAYLLVYYGPDQVMIVSNNGSVWVDNIAVEISSNLTLQCLAESNPDPNYTWFFNESSQLGYGTNYFISNVSSIHEGSYRCSVENRVTSRSSSASVIVRVFEKVTKPNLLISDEFVVEDKGAVNFTCVTPDTEIEVQWLLDNQNLLLSDRLVLSQGNRTLTITQARREDAGQYQCITQNLISTSSSDPITLTVYYGPDSLNITAGSNVVNSMETKLDSMVILQCKAHSWPPAQYRWSFKGSNSFEMDGYQLTLWPITWSHQGTYTCEAWNNLTQLSRSATVTIKVVDSSLSAGEIAGIVIGVLAFVALLIGLIYFLVIRKRKEDPPPRKVDPPPRKVEDSPPEPNHDYEIPDIAIPRVPVFLPSFPKGPQDNPVYQKELPGRNNHFPLPRNPLPKEESVYEKLAKPYTDVYVIIKPDT
ncbi:carcinoembryonic antigen-related cell adhesion molecule 5-like [Gracilinanus agilis]|uniref:carcinoembryonic antigen-related cell adhesion molecule 5-like n=1 Tax=Gracilinanus agilis TaxID=191870 RepID=UPI001CFD2BFF|nr:carcinoembryonic antigen-related cell adhesion molecule 5-like [Gracilinanus agilis]